MRAVAQHVLEVERADEEGREHAGDEQPRIALEPVSVRSFRIRSGMIGLASRDSRTMKDDEQHDGGAQDAERVRRDPAVARRR